MKHQNFYKVDRTLLDKRLNRVNDIYCALFGTIYTQAMAIAFKKYKVKVGPKLKMLEAGSGHGKFSIYWSQFGCYVWGIDVDHKQVEYCVKLATICDQITGIPTPNCRFAEGDIRDLSQFYGEYDVVFNEGVIEHFDKKVQTQILQEMVKASRNLVMVFVPDGSDPNAVEFAAKTKHHFYAGKGGMKLTEKPIKKEELVAMLHEVDLKNISTWKMNDYLMGVGQR